MIFTAYWPCGNGGRWLLEFWNFVARQVLPHAITPPDAVDPSCEDLPRVEIEGNLDRLPRPHVFEVLLKEGREHIAIGFRDQGRDSADANDPGHHSRADLQIDDAAILGSHQRGVV